MTPVILEVALNGTSLTPNPHAPRTPAAIAADAIRCIEAGAAIVHFHIEDLTLVGQPAADQYRAALEPILARFPATIFYPTVALATSIEDRFRHEAILAEAGLLRMGLVDPGSVNLGVADDEGLPALDIVYRNTFADLRHEVELCERHHLGPSVSIFEPGFLRAALAYVRLGRMPRGALLKLYFGGEEGYLGRGRGAATFGLPPTRPSLEAYLAMLGETPLPWSVAVPGGDLFATELAPMALERGGHLRVGLEDHAGPDTPTNVELVERAAAGVHAAGRRLASQAEAVALLALP